MSSYILGAISGRKTESMRDFYLCCPAILTNTLVPQLGLSSILQNQLGVALDAIKIFLPDPYYLAAIGHCAFTSLNT